jgi:divalent metal cation (Fe/Co/Zn/Cd) transporter
MSRIAAFGRFWWDFVVGDDWVAAAGVLVGLVLTAATAAWWILPAVVALVLALTLRRAIRSSL